MSRVERNEQEVHPLIRALEQSGEEVVEFAGFVGTGDDSVLRLYRDLQASAYVDIPRDAVLHREPDADGATGKVRVFVRAKAEVTELHKLRVTASASSFSIVPFAVTTYDWAINPPPLRLLSCPQKCEQEFVPYAADAVQKEVAWLQLLGRLGEGGRLGEPPPQVQMAQAAYNQARARAFQVLIFCLQNCIRTPFFDPVLEAGRIAAKYGLH
jgi:hypothetical protein